MPISNERPSPFARKQTARKPPVYRPPQADRPAKPQVEENTLQSATLQLERKSFLLTLKENLQGRFLRITEEAGGRRNNIFVPASGLEAFSKAIESMLSHSAQDPSSPGLAAEGPGSFTNDSP